MGTIAVLLLMVHTLANVISRYFLLSPLPFTNEIVTYWYMPLIAAVGFIVADMRRRHIAVDALFNLLPCALQRELSLVGAFLGAIIFALFSVSSLAEAMHGMRIGRSVVSTTELVIWPATFALPLAFAVLFAACVLRVRRTFYLSKTVDSESSVRWRVSLLGGRVVVVGTVYLCCAGLLTVLERQEVAFFELVLMLILLFLGTNVWLALALPGLIGLVVLAPRAVHTMLGSMPYDIVADWSMSALPMFIFMGILLARSGLTHGIYRAARMWFNRLPGGLALSTNVAGTGLAAVSGSTIGSTYVLSQIGIPEMLDAGYDRRLAIASVMAAGLPGQLIPPSTFLIVFAGIASVPVGPQLLAGIGPGLLVSLLYSIAIVVTGLLRPGLFGRRPGATDPKVLWSERWRSVVDVWPLPVLVCVVLGGIYSGALTGTEAGAAGAFGAVLLVLITCGASAIRTIGEAATEAVVISGAILATILGGTILSSSVVLTGVTESLISWISAADLGRTEFLVILMVMYLCLGACFEPLPMVLLTAPFLIPVLESMGVSIIWFGVFVVFMSELAILTPPVGILLFTMFNIVRDNAVSRGHNVTVADVIMAVCWLLPVAVLTGLLLILFPGIALWLPETMSQR